MSPRRQVWETLANLLQRLEQGVSARLPLTENESADPLQPLEDELRKLGKAQFKANTLTERQFARWEEALEKLQVGQAQENELIEKLVRERTTAAQRDLLKTILPALDGLENAIAGGRQYLARRDRAATLPHPTPTQAQLVSPADRAVLAAWLDGLRLVRDRLLAILEAGDVTPIPTVGRPFDPYLHKAVGVTTQGASKTGTIVSEERRGYRSPAGVLRYAEVIVYREKDEDSER